MSPYIVTTKQERAFPPNPDVAGVPSVLSRVAVTTLEEGDGLTEGERADFRSGRWTGEQTTCPDGTVIEVEQTTWARLTEAWDGSRAKEIKRAERGDPEAQQRILDAFNAWGAK